jgi:hypothetical protein
MSRGTFAPLLLGVAILAAAGGVVWYFVDQRPFDSAFLKACEEVIKDTLRSPSTYRRIQATETSEKISVDEYFNGEGRYVSDADRALQKQFHDHAVRSKALFEYDAANLYGTPLRLTSTCTYVSFDGDTSRANASVVKIESRG